MAKKIITFLLLSVFLFPVTGNAVLIDSNGFTVPSYIGGMTRGSGTGGGTAEIYATPTSFNLDTSLSRISFAEVVFPLPSLSTGTTSFDYLMTVSSGASNGCRIGVAQMTSTTTISRVSTTAHSNVSANATGTISWNTSTPIYAAGVFVGQSEGNADIRDCFAEITNLTFNDLPLYTYYSSLPEPEPGGGGGNIIIVDNIGSMTSEWECTVDGDTTNCLAVATSSTGLYNGPNFQEWLFVAGVIIFILSFMFWGRISFTNGTKKDNV